MDPMIDITLRMLAFVVVLAFPSGWGVAHALRSRRTAASLAACRATISEAGFQWRVGERSATQRYDGVVVEASIWVEDDGKPVGVRLLVEGPPLATDVTFTPDGGLTSLVRSDHLAGEARFDDHVRVGGGDPVRAQALLTAACRDAIARAVTQGASFLEGRWRATYPAADLPSGSELGRHAKQLAAAHSELEAVVEREPGEVLCELVRTDRSSGVRLAVLNLLLERGIASEDLLRDASHDLDPAVRILAAEALAEAGRPTLLDLVRTGSRTWKVRAAAALARPPLEPEVLDAVQGALIAALPDPELAAVAARSLGRVGTASSVAPLLEAARSGPARNEASEAAAAVRARLDPGTAGQLSLAAVSGGEVSQVEPSGGGLTET